MTFTGRYETTGRPGGFPKAMRQLISENFAGQAVEITIRAVIPKPSAGLRGLFFGQVLPHFMDIMRIEEGWDLHPANAHDLKVARVRVFETFLRGYTVESVGPKQRPKIRLPSFADLDEEDLRYLIDRMSTHCAEMYGRTLMDPTESEGAVCARY